VYAGGEDSHFYNVEPTDKSEREVARTRVFALGVTDGPASDL
jgi:hypothetical protein